MMATRSHKYLCFIHIMGRDDDRCAGSTDFLNQFPEISPGLRIEPGRGFIQKNNFWLIDQCRGNGKSLFLTTAEFFIFCFCFVQSDSPFPENPSVLYPDYIIHRIT